MTGPLPADGMVPWFAAGWREPSSVDQFCEHFLDRMHPDVKLIQPLAPTSHGHQAFRRIFAQLFATIPDLSAQVIRSSAVRSSATTDTVYLELELRGTIGGLPVRWQTTDRLLLTDGLITERRSYFNPSPILVAVVTRPWAWPKILIASTRVALAARRESAPHH